MALGSINPASPRPRFLISSDTDSSGNSISVSTVAVCYLSVMFFGVKADVLAQLPGLVGAEAGVMATMAPVLGIASYFRGKMQASPAVTSDNRG